jgi:hypothetical protein
VSPNRRRPLNLDVATLGSRWGAPLLATAILLALYWWTLAPSISELHDNVDSAELVTVASVLGVAHPPGSALWLPLGRAALEAFPFLDEPAQRTNLLSALCMAAAGGLIAVAARRWRPETPAWAALLAGVLAGVAPIPWAQGLVTEVLALQALLTALALVLAVDAVRGRSWPWFALILGLLSWNHPTGLALAVPLGLACVIRGRPTQRALNPAIALFLLPGLFSIGYLLLRADASIAWGDTGTVAGVWDHLSERVYQDVIDRSPGDVLSAVPETLRRTLRQSPPLAWPLLPLGAVAIARLRPTLSTALAVAVVILVLFVGAYRATGRQDYLAPVAFVLALLAAWGADEAWDAVRGRFRERGAVLGVGVLLWGLVAAWVVVNGDDVSRRGDTALRDAAVARLETADAGTTIETSDDVDTFSLWYARVVLGVRPDVGVEDVRGLAPVIRPGE